MAEPFLGEVRMMSFIFPPKGWALCNGQMLPINQNQALFSLLGTQFGGNGQTTFGLPNLQGRVPIHMGQGHVIGEAAGAPSHTLISSEMVAHNHFVAVSSAATGGNANGTGRFLGGGNNVYHTLSTPTSVHPQTLTMVGGSQPHENKQPFLTISFCIALVGIFPSQN